MLAPAAGVNLQMSIQTTPIGSTKHDCTHADGEPTVLKICYIRDQETKVVSGLPCPVQRKAQLIRLS